MARRRFWRPSIRCDRCRAIRPADAARAWLMQPMVSWDAGRIHFVCRRCRSVERAPENSR